MQLVDGQVSREDERLAGERLLRGGRNRVVADHVVDLLGDRDGDDAADGLDQPAHLLVDVARPVVEHHLGPEPVAGTAAGSRTDPAGQERADVEQRNRELCRHHIAADRPPEGCRRVEVDGDSAQPDQKCQRGRHPIAGHPPVAKRDEGGERPRERGQPEQLRADLGGLLCRCLQDRREHYRGSPPEPSSRGPV